MPRIALPGEYPFPGAKTKWQNPIPAEFWDPKEWGTGAAFFFSIRRIIDPNAHFITEGVAFGDIVFICSSDESESYETTVFSVFSETEIVTSLYLDHNLFNITYKVGLKAHHTLQSLGQIIDARHLYALTFHFATLWTQVPFIDFNDDETGDVYCIDPPSGGRLNSLINSWKPPPEDPEAPNPWKNMNPRPKI